MNQSLDNSLNYYLVHFSPPNYAFLFKLLSNTIYLFHSRVQNYMKNNDDKFITIFFNMYCDVHYYSTKFEIKIQLVYRETKRTNCIMGVK